MSNSREVRYYLRTKETSGCTLPSDGVIGEPFVNSFEGRMFFYGTSGGTFTEATGQQNVFEVGGNVGYVSVLSGINVNDLFIVTGTTDEIINYGGQTDLTGYFLSGTSTGFVLGLISDIQVTGGTSGGGGYPIQPGLNTYTGGTFSSQTVNISAATLNYLSATTISADTIYTHSISGLSPVNINNVIVDRGSITASTQTLNDLIFVTGGTKSGAYAGKVYFDNDENALSYFPYTNNMDVTLNIGQESFIRIYNNTGAAILNGTVVSISDSLSGVATVVLANATDVTGGTGIVSGIATHRIEDENYGFITNFGIVRDLNLSSFADGDRIYLSDVTPGGFIKLEDLENSSKASKIGRVLSNDSSNGKLMVLIENEFGKILGLSDRQESVFTLESTSTGLFKFSGLSYTSTYFNVAPVEGWLIDSTTDIYSPTIKHINYTGATGLTSVYLSSNTGTYLIISSASTLVMQATEPTPEERRDNLYIGKVTHPNYTTYTSIQHQLLSMLSPFQSTYDMFSSIKYIKQGLVCSANGANLKIDVSTGKLFGLGINFPYNTKKPNELSYSAKTQATFRYRTQTGGTSLDVTDIDNLNYDLGGAITTISGGVKRATNQRIYLFPSGEIRIGYGQTVYDSLVDAIAAIQSEEFVEYSNFSENAILIGILSVTKGASVLNITADAKFFQTSKLGENIGGAAGTSTATLQKAYDNSTIPQILTNPTLDGLSIKNGTGNPDNTTNLLKGVDSTDTITSIIRADGYISATTLDGSIVLSAGTNLYDIFLTTADGNDVTRIQLGLNTYTAGTENNPSVNISAATLSYLSATTVSADTIFSASTNLSSIFAPISLSEFPIDVDRYGFLNHIETGISFDGVDVFTLSGTSWSYYRAGIKHTITGNKQTKVAAPMISGTKYFIYIDSTDGELISSTSTWTLNDTKVPVAIVSWNNGLSPKFIMCDERHQCVIDRSIHRYEHFTEGTRYVNGAIVSGYTLNSSTDTDKTFLITETVIADEDIFETLIELSDGDGVTPNYYNIFRTGTTSYAWSYDDMPFKYVNSGAAPYGFIEYDNGGTSTPGSSGNYVNTYIFCTNAVSNYEPVVDYSNAPMRFMMLQGRGNFNTAALAYAESFFSFSLAGFPVVEGVTLYQLTWRLNQNNTVKGRCVLNRVQRITANIISTVSGGGAIEHNTTAGLQGGTTGQYFHLNDEQHDNLTSGVFSATSISSTTLYSTNISGGTINSGTTNLYDIFLTTADGNDITRVQPGLNTYTAGTENNPSVNISAATLNSLNVAGNSELAKFSAATIFSASTNLYDIFAPIGTVGGGSTTHVQPGLNTYTAGTESNPSVNISSATLTTASITTLSATTYYSGSTNLYDMFTGITYPYLVWNL